MGGGPQPARRAMAGLEVHSCVVALEELLVQFLLHALVGLLLVVELLLPKPPLSIGGRSLGSKSDLGRRSGHGRRHPDCGHRQLSGRGRTRASSVSVLSRGRGESPAGRMQAEQKLVFAMFRNRPPLLNST